jgi:eukaryotic-like serine/threonine-protein kinase
MTGSSEWDRVKEVFHAAMERPPEERAGFVRAACGEADGIRQEVESLLRAHEAAGPFAEGSPLDVLDHAVLEPGDRLGPYEIVAPRKRGGMGEVYKARDTRLGRDVAIKVLPAVVADDPAARARFEREARAIAALSHPHICTLFDIGQETVPDGAGCAMTYLVMELLDGETLANRLRAGALPPARVIEVLLQIAGALENVHRLGIVHRDLKPANIMLTASGVKLLDFGLAKRLAVGAVIPAPTLSPDSRLSSTGQIIGTVRYMAPEQLEGRDADARTDLFALGVIGYEALTGRHPFDGESEAALISAILRDTPSPVCYIAPSTPDRLGRIVEACLEKDPDRRWQSPADLARELDWLLDELTRPPAERTSSTYRQQRVWPLGAIAVAGGLALLAVVWPFTSAVHSPSPVRFTMPTLGVLSEGVGEVIALSLDGRDLVYRGGGPDDDPNSLLYRRPLASLNAVPLRGTEGAKRPVFSPDGRSIAFADAMGNLATLALDGGVPVTVCKCPFNGGAWGADGTIVFAGRGLARVPAAGGEPEQLTQLLSGETNHRWPR